MCQGPQPVRGACSPSGTRLVLPPLTMWPLLQRTSKCTVLLEQEAQRTSCVFSQCDPHHAPRRINAMSRGESAWRIRLHAAWAGPSLQHFPKAQDGTGVGYRCGDPRAKTSAGASRSPRPIRAHWLASCLGSPTGAVPQGGAAGTPGQVS